jgi:hypothetical protein
MKDLILDGGPGTIPTLLFGLLLLFVATRYSIRPERRWMPLMLALGTATLAMGALGFVAGLKVIAHFAGRSIAEPVSKTALISVVGVGEALNNVAFALFFVVLAALAACVGTWRNARTAPA